MMTIKNILVATDFSEASEAAISYARELARAFNSTLHVLHVTANVCAQAAGIEGYTADWAALQQQVDDAARKQLNRVVADRDWRMFGSKTVVKMSNSPAQMIVSYANDAQIDLIVVGTHGRGMEHVLMGSVAERVVRTAPCPVLTVRRVGRASPWSEARETVAHA